jgi:hypothetical protein
MELGLVFEDDEKWMLLLGLKEKDRELIRLEYFFYLITKTMHQ